MRCVNIKTSCKEKFYGMSLQKLLPYINNCGMYSERYYRKTNCQIWYDDKRMDQMSALWDSQWYWRCST